MDPDPKKSWYVQRGNGTVEGPYLDQQILKMAREGKIFRGHRLKHAERTKGQWMPAAEVPVVGKMVSQKASPSPEPPTDLPPPIDNGSLGEGLPSWTAAASVPSTSLPVGTEYWNNVTQGLASQQAEQASARVELDENARKASEGRRSHTKRQLYDVLIAGVVAVLLVGILISGGLFLAGGLLLGTSGSEPEQISDRAKANRKELKNGIDRAVQVVTGSGYPSAPVIGGGSNSNQVASSGRTQSIPRPRIDFSQLSGIYDVGEQTLANSYCVSIDLDRLNASTTTGVNLYEFDTKFIELLGTKGCFSANLTIEPRFEGTEGQTVLCSIKSIARTTPERQKFSTEFGQQAYDKIMQAYKEGALVVFLSNDELQNVSSAKDALRQKLANQKPKDIVDRQKAIQLIDALNKLKK